MAVSACERSFRGEPAITLTSGLVRFVVLPHLGMTGVSLRVAGTEVLALPGGPAALRGGHTTGLPLLAPWANRLAGRRYRAAGVAVEVRGRGIRADAHGLPIHGLLVGRGAWTVDRLDARRGRARLAASTLVDAPAFPFPHRIDLEFLVHDHGLRVDTAVTPTARRRVPVAFGWHPYLRVPRAPRRAWRLRLPARTRLALDGRGIPTGATSRCAATDASIGATTADDLFALGRDRRLGIATDEHDVSIRLGAGYPNAQVWVPAGRPFVALEPMTAPTNALGDGRAPLVAPGDRFTASFTIRASGAAR